MGSAQCTAYLHPPAWTSTQPQPTLQFQHLLSINKDKNKIGE